MPSLEDSVFILLGPQDLTPRMHSIMKSTKAERIIKFVHILEAKGDLAWQIF
jgi:hypothetical protein